MFLYLTTSCTHLKNDQIHSTRGDAPPSAVPPASSSSLPDVSVSFTEMQETYDCEGTLHATAFVTPSKVHSVMLVGDSLAVGMGGEFNRIAHRLGYTSVVHAKTGSTTQQWLKWIDRDLVKNRPDVVFVSLGTNDAAAPNALTLWPDMYERLAAKVTDTGATLVWIGPPEVSSKRVKKLDEVRLAIRSAAPFYFGSEALRIKQWDGIHTDAAGYATWIQHVWDSTAAAGIVGRRVNS